jgi:BirA family biotin operon repressor/biotin-[acetyl-CoA-carboxylase] ligase
MMAGRHTPVRTSRPDLRRYRRAVTGAWQIEWVDETGSTNVDLLDAGAAGAPDRTVLAARHQTAGRGRLDRRWEAPPGANLLVSLLFRDVPEHPYELTRRVALAAAIAAERTVGVSPVLKWPNDLLLQDGAKLAGVLAQAGAGFVVVGIGVNVGWAPPGGAHLGDGRSDPVTPAELLDALLAAYDELPLDVGPLYRSRLATLGQLVRVELPGERFITGRAVDVEPDGRLVVLDDCAITHRIDTGDVVHLRPA